MPALDRKLERIRSGAYTPEDFIIADAKDGDIAFGCAAPVPDARRAGGHGDRASHLAAIREMARSGLVDIMLVSASTGDRLLREGLFAASDVTLAVRLNDTTDIWSARGSRYREAPSRHHRTARVEQVRALTDLGLYSITFSNERDIDALNAEAYSDFRAEAAAHGMRHFLEVFNPAFDIALVGEADVGTFINDNIVRTLAGVMARDCPLFLKIQYNGPRAMEELASYDPGHLVVGILGGSAGTTRDTFELLAQAERYGARVALFGRKIHFAESPVHIVTFMREVLARAVTPEEAVKAYHSAIRKSGISPRRELEDDSAITEPALKAAA